MSLISFNKSTVNKSDFLTNIDPYQIVPASQNFITDKLINSYPNITFDNKILIHSSFTTKPFLTKQLNSDYFTSNLKGYDKLADKLKTKYILFHGPSNYEEYNNFVDGLKSLNDNINNKIICIEIPYFASTLREHINNYYEFIDNYLNTVIEFKKTTDKNEFQLIIDTAHLHSNGLNGKQMIELLSKYKDNYDFIHLNGNIKKQFTSDEHVQIDSENDKIEFSYDILKFVVSLNKICICETKDGDYEYYKEIANEFGYSIVKENSNYSY